MDLKALTRTEMLKRIEILEDQVQELYDDICAKEPNSANCHTYCISHKFWNHDKNKYSYYYAHHMNEQIFLSIDKQHPVLVDFCPICGKEDNS